MTEKQLVELFGREMYAKAVERRERYEEFGWRKKDLKTLYKWLKDEVDELMEADDPKEAIDVALLALFIWDVINRKEL